MRTTFLCVTWRARSSSLLKRLDLIAPRVFVGVARQDGLDRDRDPELVVVGLVDRAHAAAPEQADDGVAGAEAGPREQLRARGRGATSGSGDRLFGIGRGDRRVGVRRRLRPAPSAPGRP